MKIFRKKTKGYVSPADQLLAEFDVSHPLSKEQQAEARKYRRIHRLRDQKGQQG